MKIHNRGLSIPLIFIIVGLILLTVSVIIPTVIFYKNHTPPNPISLAPVFVQPPPQSGGMILAQLQAQGATPTSPQPQTYIDPNLKIAQCEATKESEIGAYTLSAKQEISTKLQNIQQQIQGEKIAYLGKLMAGLNNEETQNESSLSVNDRLELNNEDMASINSIDQTVDQGYQDEYDQDYAELQGEYENMIATYTQSALAEYAQCLSN